MKALKFPGGEFGDYFVGGTLRIDRTAIPDTPGIFAVVRRADSSLVFIGRARGKPGRGPRTIRQVVERECFRERTGDSRLRRKVAVELGIALARDASGRPSVGPRHEARITRHIDAELCFSFIGAPSEEVDALEIAAIAELKPEWNIGR